MVDSVREIMKSSAVTTMATTFLVVPVEDISFVHYHYRHFVVAILSRVDHGTVTRAMVTAKTDVLVQNLAAK